MTRINTNVQSLVAQNRLAASNNDLNTSLTRLSTGLRINTGADDPAGLIASEALRSEITSLGRAISNTNRASQIISTADSALGEVSNLLNDIRGLVVEAANSGALSPDEIAANQLQVDSSLEAINRISQTTTFQGRNLLDGSLSFQTEAGVNFGNIANLQIDQANLGSTGAVAVDVSISAAAEQAQVSVEIPEVVTAPPESTVSTGTLSLGAPVAEVAPQGEFTLTGTIAAEQASVDITLSGGIGELNVAALAGGGFDGAAGNSLDVEIVTVASGTASSASLTAADELTITLEEGVDLTQALSDISTNSGAALTALGLSVGGTVGTGNIANTTDTTTGGGTDTLAGGANEQSPTVDFGLTGRAGLGADANDLQVVFDTSGTGAPSAAFTAGDDTTPPQLTITVDGSGPVNLSDIQLAIANEGTFSVTSDPSVSAFTEIDPADLPTAALTAVVPVGDTDDSDGTISGVTAADTPASINVTAVRPGTTGVNPVDIQLVAATDGTAAPTATFDAGSDTLTVTVGDNFTADQVIAAIEAASIDDADPATGNITLTAEFDADNSTAAEGDTLAATDISNIDGAGAEATTTNLTAEEAADLLGTSATGGLAEDLVFELQGTDGSEVFNVSAGTSIDDLVSQINLVSDATGVIAEADGQTLNLTSTAFGSEAVVDLRVISEADTGTFTTTIGSGIRDNGADIEARVNGIEASGRGNELSINTATLDLSLTVDAGSSDDISFSITGGGALFQLGADVVGNQQARIGIDSVNTARLGGPSGQLFQLGSGGSATLLADPTSASEIVTEAIDQVTSLRGRLGAFQATTLNSNFNSLNETQANLLEAESSIRDADFAQESANLTRAQILVQSGTNVLSLANQNPQNVLALLG